MTEKTTVRKSNWEIVKGRYGKPVLTPIWGMDVTDSEPTEAVYPQILTAVEEETLQKGTILQASGPNNRNRDRSDELVQHQVQKDERTIPNQVIGKERRETTTAEYEIPIYEVGTDGPWRTVTGNNRNRRPTQILKTAVTESDCDDFKRRLQTVEADRPVDRNEKVKTDSGQGAAVPPAGISMSAIDSVDGLCTDCTKRSATRGTVQTTGGDSSNSVSGMRPAVVHKLEHKEDAGVMHYQWIVRESIMVADRDMPSNYLEIPELKIPKLFLDLAEEARDVEVINDIYGCTEVTKSQATGLRSQILVTVMTDGEPIPLAHELVKDVVPTEMRKAEHYVGRFKPMNWGHQAVSPDTTEQPDWLGLGPGGRQTATGDTGGPVVNLNEPGDPADKLEPVVLLGQQWCTKVTDMVVPIDQDVNVKEDNDLVDRSGPEETHGVNKPPAFLTLKMDWMEKAVLSPVGPEGNSSERDEAGKRSDPATSKSKTDRPVWTEEGGDAPNYSGLPDVMSTGQLEIVSRSDPVGLHSRQDEPVPPRLSTDQGEYIPTHGVHPGVRMFRVQPVADGPAGPDGSRRPVGTGVIHAVHNDGRPTAGGPVGRLPDPATLNSTKSFPDDSYQPLFTGPSGTNEWDVVVDRSRPTASGPLGRQYSLDPMGPRATLSLGDRNQPPSVGPVGRPGLFERPVDRVTESDFKLTTQTRSESGSETVVTDSVIRTESEAQTVRANISMANGPTDLNAISSSSDAVRANISIVNGPMLTTQTRSGSGSETVVTDSVIRTESDAQTVRANISIANGPTDPSVSPPSSDSGIHSWTEQWENMSENSTDSSVHHAVVSDQEDAGRVSHLVCRTPPNTEEEDDSDCSDADGLLAMKLGGYPLEETYGLDDRTWYSATTLDKKTDIAVLSDFSDESSEPPAGPKDLFTKLIMNTVPRDGAWTRWDYGTLPDITDPEFAPMIQSMMQQALAHDADPRLDRYYPKLVQSLVKAGRMTVKVWAEHDHRLKEEGRICTATDCRCSTQWRTEMLVRTFGKEMSSVDSVPVRFPARHVGKLITRLNGGEIEEEVPETYTPPIRRRRGRKYASLRKYETDVEDYFSCSEEEEDWVDRTYSWY